MTSPAPLNCGEGMSVGREPSRRSSPGKAAPSYAEPSYAEPSYAEPAASP
jgi:hypothetical protein